MLHLKRLAACVLALALLCAIPCALAETEFINIDSVYTNSLGYTMSQWTETDTSRTLLTVTLMMDLMASDEPEECIACMAEALTNNATYIVVVSDFIVLEFFAEDVNLSIVYYPGTQLAQYTLTDGCSPDTAARIMKSMKDDSSIRAYYLMDPQLVFGLIETLTGE